MPTKPRLLRRPAHPLDAPGSEVLQYFREVLLSAHQGLEKHCDLPSAVAANVAARAQALRVALDAIALSRLTALRKPTGSVRGIERVSTLRLPSAGKSLQLELDAATRSIQTRAGTDSLAAMLRAAFELDPRATVVSLSMGEVLTTASAARVYLSSYTIPSHRSGPLHAPCLRTHPFIRCGTTRHKCTTSRGMRRLKVSSRAPVGRHREVPESRPTWARRGSSTQVEGMRHPASTHPDFVKTQAANRIDAEAALFRKFTAVRSQSGQ